MFKLAQFKKQGGSMANLAQRRLVRPVDSTALSAPEAARNIRASVITPTRGGIDNKRKHMVSHSICYSHI